MNKLDALKKAIIDTVDGLTLAKTDHDIYEIGGVSIIRDVIKSHLGTNEEKFWSVCYAEYRSSDDRMKPDNIDIERVGNYRTFDAAVSCAVSTCVDWAITDFEESIAHKGEQV